MSSPARPLEPEIGVLQRGGLYDPAMRVGDAERGDIIDRLSKHYSDGRLDHAEFSERMDRAMTARTMADLAGLLADLPGNGQLPVQLTGSRRHQRRLLKLQLEHQRLQVRQQLREQRRAEHQRRLHAMRWLPVFLAVLIATIVVIHTLTHSVVAWVLLALAAFVWLRRNAGSHHGG